MTTPWRLKEKLKLHTILKVTTIKRGNFTWHSEIWWWLHAYVYILKRYQSNRPVEQMKRTVNWSIFKFKSSERFSSPYMSSCVRSLFERLVTWTNGRRNYSTVPARRSFH